MDDVYCAISSLIARYARSVDQADFATLGRLFEDGRVTVAGSDLVLEGGAQIAAYWAGVNRSYGTAGLLTHHMISNLDFERIAGDRMRVGSYFVVFQSTPDFPLAPIVTGRYLDEFVQRDGNWRFATKHIDVTLVGDVSHHLTMDLKQRAP